jgi:hypothetical protein
MSSLPHKQSARPTPGGDASLLMKTGFWLLLAGMAALLIIEIWLGGIGRKGVQGNTAWLLLVAAGSCVPLGTMSLLLGGAKWLSHRRR